MVRTVAGLKPVSVLWRRMDASFVDPLELRYDSRIGTPGMTEALRAGTISMVNALGSGILETRAFSAFFPRLSQELLGVPLQLPTIATWWCGGETERRHVVDHFDEMMIDPPSPPARDRRPCDHAGSTLAPTPGPRDRAQRGARRASSGDRCGSTAPVNIEGELVPRPITLRVYAARTGAAGPSFGGSRASARPGHHRHRHAAQARRPTPGGAAPRSACLLPRQATHHNASGTLPAARPTTSSGSAATPALRGDGGHPARLQCAPRGNLEPRPAAAGRYPRLSRRHRGRRGAAAAARPARQHREATRSAGQIRDRFSPDGWLALADLRRRRGASPTTSSPATTRRAR